MTSLSPDPSVPQKSCPRIFPPCASFEKPYDMDIVRKIVEREGCIEALQQLLEQPRLSGISRSPIVFQSVIDQLRLVSLQIVEDIEKWQIQQKAKAQATNFQWRDVNYLLKMTTDLDFLASYSGVPLLDSLQVLRLTQNPFLSQLHLDHPAFRESDVQSALHLFGNWVGDVSMRRVFHASKLLIREHEVEAKSRKIRQDTSNLVNTNQFESESVAAVTPLTAALQQQQGVATTRTKVHFASKHDVAAVTNPREAAMREDIVLSRELIMQAEHELGAMRDELAALQERLEDTRLPDKRRQLQTRIGTLVNDLKFRSGDLYQRKNELKRKVAIYRSSKDQRRSRHNRSDAVQSQPTRREHKERVYSSLFETTLLEDEQLRNDLVLRVNASLTKTRTDEHQSSKGIATPSRKLQKESGKLREELSLESWGVREVQNFLDSLGLDNGRYGATFHAQGIDGALLLQATDRDLDELGVNIRLHRIRILAECKMMVSHRR